MTRTEHLLIILAEECAEIAQRASKALRFGLTDTDPVTGKTAARRLMEEIADFNAVIDLLRLEPEAGMYFAVTNMRDWHGLTSKKKMRVEEFLKYSQACGTLDPPPQEPK